MTRKINRGIEKVKKLEENYYKFSADLMQKIRTINRTLNGSYKRIDKKYTIMENSNEELAVAYARAKLDLITKILDEVDEI